LPRAGRHSMSFNDGCKDGPVLIVGSVAYDSVRTPFGKVRPRYRISGKAPVPSVCW